MDTHVRDIYTTFVSLSVLGVHDLGGSSGDQSGSLCSEIDVMQVMYSFP